jgi:cytochrome c-type biogenesis protein CcmH
VTLLLIAAVLAAVAALAYLALRGPAAPSTLEDRTRAVAESLQCPACQDLSVEDSPSAIAGEIRSDIRRRLAEGQTPEQIRGSYVARYGPWILLSPPRSGVTLVAWLVPGLLVGAGVALVLTAVRRWTAAGAASLANEGGADGGLSPSDRRLLDGALAAEEPE